MILQFFGTMGSVQTRDNTNTTFLVKVDDCSILVDTSGNPVQSLSRAVTDPSLLDILIITDAHTDHIYALPSLVHNLWMMRRKKPLALMANSRTIAKARELCNFFGLLEKEKIFRIDWIAPNENKIDAGIGLEISLFPVIHSSPTTGLKISTNTGSLVYSCDTAPTERVIKEASGCDCLIHEASGNKNQAERLNKAGHTTGQQAGEVAKRSGAKRLFLCHFDASSESSPLVMLEEAKNSFQGEVVIPELFRPYEI